MLLLCPLAIWSGYKLQKLSKAVVAFQILVLSAVYTWLCWQLFASEGRPLSLAGGSLLALAVGSAWKWRERQKRILQAKQLELNLRNQELHQSRLAIVRQDEAERRLLAADLHDQILSDLRMVVKTFEQYVEQPDHGVAEVISSQLKQTINDVREIMDDLCPIMLEEFGLAAAIEDRLDKAVKISRLKVGFSCAVDEQDLERFSPVELQLLYRLVQEAITNARN